MESQSRPPTEWDELPFYIKTNLLIGSLSILLRVVPFVLNRYREMIRSRLACQQKSATFFSNVLVPILQERVAAQNNQGLDIVPFFIITISLCGFDTSSALTILDRDGFFRPSKTHEVVSRAEQGGVNMRLYATAAIDRFFPPVPDP